MRVVRLIFEADVASGAQVSPGSSSKGRVKFQHAKGTEESAYLVTSEVERFQEVHCVEPVVERPGIFQDIIEKHCREITTNPDGEVHAVETRATRKSQPKVADVLTQHEDRIEIDHGEPRRELFMPPDEIVELVGESRVTEVQREDGTKTIIRDSWRTAGSRILAGGAWTGRTTFFLLVAPVLPTCFPGQ